MSQPQLTSLISAMSCPLSVTQVYGGQYGTSKLKSYLAKVKHYVKVGSHKTSPLSSHQSRAIEIGLGVLGLELTALQQVKDEPSSGC